MPVVLDTLLLVASLHRPIPAPVTLRPTVLVPVTSKSVPAPESLTTCYQNQYGSCWSED